MALGRCWAKLFDHYPVSLYVAVDVLVGVKSAAPSDFI